MKKTHLHIKNMCCTRCVEMVKQLFSASKYKAVSVMLGEAIITGELTSNDTASINQKLATIGFSIAKSQRDKKIVKIKTAIINYLNDIVIHEEKNIKLSNYLVDKIGQSYYHLSRTFSVEEGLTIEEYLMMLKTEKAKEMISQNEFSFAEISSALGYSSSQTFSTQFKKVTGKTPGEYRLNPIPGRVHLDWISDNISKSKISDSNKKKKKS